MCPGLRHNLRQSPAVPWLRELLLLVYGSWMALVCFLLFLQAYRRGGEAGIFGRSVRPRASEQAERRGAGRMLRMSNGTAGL